jgi:putative tricarboxylic transport membrane protein
MAFTNSRLLPAFAAARRHLLRIGRGSALAGLTVGGAAALLTLPAPSAHAQAWKPSRTVELVVFASPGGGNDKAARALQKIWADNKIVDAVVVNRVGGGGTLAYTYVSQKQVDKVADPHYIAIAQAGILTNQLAGRTTLGIADMTVLPYIGTEPVSLAVRADSPLKSLKDVADRLRKDPASLSFSPGSTLASTNHFVVALMARQLGADARKLRMVTFGGGAEAATNVLGGHIDAMINASNNAVPHVQAGKMRMLGIASPKRAASLPDVPTFREMGFDVIQDSWYVFLGPRGMTPGQIAFWDDVFARTMKTPEWKKFVEENGWEFGFMPSKETAAFMKKEWEEARGIMQELGVLKVDGK